MRLSRPWKLVLGVVIGLVVLFIVYAGFLAWQMEKSLSKANDDAHRLKAAVQSGNADQIRSAASAFTSDAHQAHSRAHNPVWSVVTHLPFFGDDARGVRTVADVAQQLSNDGIEQLADAASQLNLLLPKGGAVDLTQVAKIQPEVAQGDTALQKAETSLDSQDPSHFVGALKLKYRDLQSTVDQAASVMSSANKAMQILPTMLGASSPKNYLMVFYNNAEIRAGGGLPGAVSLLHADQGHIQMVKEVAGSALGEAPAPVLPLTNAEQRLWSDQLGTYFLDANFTPDFNRTAELMQARWQQKEGGHIDGVMAIDPVTLSYILKATGPITVDGVQLTSSNAVDYLLHQIYIDKPNPADQDAFFGQVAQQFFDKISAGAGSAQGIIQGLAQGTQEHRVDLHSFDSSVQSVLDGTKVAGQLPTTATKDPQVGFFVNDNTGSKMSYYLRYDVQVSPTYCNNNTQSLSGEAKLSSTAPADAATTLPPYITGGGSYGVPAGQELVTVLLFGPIGGKINGVQINSENVPYDNVMYEGRPVARTFVTLTPGSNFDVTWTMQGGPGQTGDVHTQVTPSVVSGTSSSVSPSVCG